MHIDKPGLKTLERQDAKTPRRQESKQEKIRFLVDLGRLHTLGDKSNRGFISAFFASFASRRFMPFLLGVLATWRLGVLTKSGAARRALNGAPLRFAAKHPDTPETGPGCAGYMWEVGA